MSTWGGRGKKEREMELCDAALPRMRLKTLSRLIHLLVLHLGLHRCHLIIRVSWHAYTETCVFLWFPPRPLSASLTSNMDETWQPSQFRPGQKILRWGFVMLRSEWVQRIHSWRWGVGVGWGGDEAEIFCGVSSGEKKLYRKVACANTEQLWHADCSRILLISEQLAVHWVTATPRSTDVTLDSIRI